jgi:hypothetical protein
MTSHRLIIAAASMAMLSGGALAQERPDSLRISCGAAASLVRNAGAIVMRTGPNIYDRYVSSRAYCARDEQTEPRWIAAGDTPQCFIGYTCERRYSDPGER